MNGSVKIESGRNSRAVAERRGSVLAAADGLTYSARIDGDDLFAPFLEILNAGMIAD